MLLFSTSEEINKKKFFLKKVEKQKKKKKSSASCTFFFLSCKFHGTCLASDCGSYKKVTLQKTGKHPRF